MTGVFGGDYYFQFLDMLITSFLLKFILVHFGLHLYKPCDGNIIEKLLSTSTMQVQSHNRK